MAFDPLRPPREVEAEFEDFCNAIEMASENNCFQMQLAFVFKCGAGCLGFFRFLWQCNVYGVAACHSVFMRGWQFLYNCEFKVELLDYGAISVHYERQLGEGPQIITRSICRALRKDHGRPCAPCACNGPLLPVPITFGQLADGQDVSHPYCIRWPKGQILHLNAGGVSCPLTAASWRVKAN